MPTRVVHRGQHDGRSTVGGRADVEQVQRVGDDGTAQHVVDRDLLAVARVRVLQPVARVLHLHRGEVLRGGAVQVHPPARVEREVAGVGHPQQPEPQPVGVVPPLPRVGREEALRGGVRADHERHFAQPGEDPRASGVERLRSGRAGGVRRGHACAVPPQCLREGGAGDVAAVPVAHGLATHDQVDVLPRDVAVRECLPCCVYAVAHEVAPPLAPGVHPDSEHCDVPRISWTHWSASSPSSVTGFQRQMVRSPESSV